MRIILFLLIVFLNSCTEQPGAKNIVTEKDTYGDSLKPDRIGSDSLIKFVPPVSDVSDSVGKRDLAISNADFQIISAIKQVDTTSDELPSDMKACNTWKLSKKDILDIFRSSKEISGTEWDLAYAVMPCSYKGEFLMNGEKGTYEINAGSFIGLRFEDRSILLGCTKKSKYKYFLEHPNYE